MTTCMGDAWRTYIMQATSWEEFADVDLNPLPVSSAEGAVV